MASSSGPPPPNVKMPLADDWCCTRMNHIKYTFLWTINDFSLRHEEVGGVMKSSTFPAGGNDDFQWCLWLYPKGVNIESKDYLSLYLVLCKKKDVRATFRLCLLNARKEEAKSMKSQIPHRFIEGEQWGYKNFISRTTLFSQALALLPDDKLTIFCEVRETGESRNESGHSKGAQFNVRECRLSHDLGMLFENQKVSDVVLSASRGEFHAHKAVLAARSPVFAAMFEHEMTERKSNRVEITDIDQEVLSEMLRFIYTGKVANIKLMAGGLFTAADKYGIDRLKEMCEEALYTDLSIASVADTLILADLHGADQLKAEAIAFVNTHTTDVVKTSGWKSLLMSHPHLITEVLVALAKEHDQMSKRRRNN